MKFSKPWVYEATMQQGNDVRAAMPQRWKSIWLKCALATDEGGGWGEKVEITGARGPTLLHMFLSLLVVTLLVHCTN